MKAPVQVLAVIDANSSGVSGDKYLGALVNTGGLFESVRKGARVVAEYLPGTSRMDVEARRVERGGIGGHLVTIKSEEPALRRKGGVILRVTEKCSRKLGLSGSGAKFSVSTVETLLHAESKVHARCCWWRHLSLFRPFVSEPTSGCS